MVHRANRPDFSNLDSLKVARGVTCFAVSSEIAGMRIAVTFGTTMASHRESQIQLRDGGLLPIVNAKRRSLRGSRLMAQRACRFLVWPALGKLRHTVVVELRRALLGAVALATVLA